jgi:hypothetical protein
MVMKGGMRARRECICKIVQIQRISSERNNKRVLYIVIYNTVMPERSSTVVTMLGDANVI